MTVSATFLNNQTQKPELYIGKTDLNAYTLTVTSDSTAAVPVQDIRIPFPANIMTPSDIQGIRVTTSGWTGSVSGTYLILSGAASISNGQSLTIELANVGSSLRAATQASLSIRVNGQVISPTIKVFLLNYPDQPKNLADYLLVQLLPAAQIYRTPTGDVQIMNVLSLLLTSKSIDQPLVTTPWTVPPQMIVSFVYGEHIGSLTTADPPTDPFSAWNIHVSVDATYIDGIQTFEWTASNPDPGSGASEPTWVLQPVSVNQDVLGPKSGASASFKLAHISTQAPKGATQMYIQFSGFPGYNDGYFTLSLQKMEPQSAIIFFDVSPTHVASLGDQVTLSWQTFDVARVKLLYGNTVLDSNLGQINTGVQGVASCTVSVRKTTLFTLEAYKTVDAASPSSVVERTASVPPVQITEFVSNVSSGVVGTPATLSWKLNAALDAQIQSSQEPPYSIPSNHLVSGSKDVYPQKPGTYTLIVHGDGGPLNQTIHLFFLKKGWSTQTTSIVLDAQNQPLLMALNNVLWLMTGGASNPIYTSVDGHVWTQVGTLPTHLPLRGAAGGVSFNQRLWIMGGLGRNNQCFNDIWSSADGITWDQVTSNAPWSARSNFGCIQFQNKVWILGGQDQNLQPLNDIWYSSDGINWTPAAKPAAWSPRSSFGLTIFNNQLAIVGGSTGLNTLTNECWLSSDGLTWTQVQASVVTPRANPILYIYNKLLIVFGGTDVNGHPVDDSFGYGNGWVTIPSIAWNIVNPGYTVFQNALWVAGGTAIVSSGATSNTHVLVIFPVS